MTDSAAQPTALPYGVLTQTHPTYAADIWRELDDLYVGGYQLASRASDYLPRYVNEDAKRYAERVKSVAYLNYLGSITDHLIAHLFGRELRVAPAADADDPTTAGTAPSTDGFWDAFAADADKRGNSLNALLRSVAPSLLVKGRAIIGCDMPAVSAVPASRAAEDAMGAGRGYAFEVPVESLLDWEKGAFGAYTWAIVQRTIVTRQSPATSRGGIVEEFKVWSLDNGVAVWATYRTEERAPSKAMDGSALIPLVDSGRTSFRRIPLVEIVLPSGLHVGNKIGPLAKEHFQRRSALVSAENKSLFSIPTLNLGPEMGSPGSAWPSEAQQDPRRGDDPVEKFRAAGYLVIGQADKLSFPEPTGAAYSVVDGQLSALVDEMYRVVHQMAQSVAATSSAVGRSGDSKRLDQRTTEIVLGVLGQIFRDAARAIYTTISEARGENVVWTPHGLDNFSEEDRDALVAEAVAAASITIPSLTFQKLYKSRVATALLGPVEPNTVLTIQDEIEAAVTQADAAAKAPPAAPAPAAPDAPAPKPNKPSPVPTTAPAVAPATPPPGATNTQQPTTNLRGVSTAGVAEAVYTQLLEDFPKEPIQWVRAAQWEGPKLVPLDQIDFSGRADWAATKDPDHVNDFVKRLKAGEQLKPIVLVNEPTDNGMIVTDGHHRLLAYEQMKMPALAFVAQVGAVSGPWDVMHESQGSGASVIPSIAGRTSRPS